MDFDKAMTIEEVFAEADRRSKATKSGNNSKAKPSFEDLLSSGDVKADIRRSRRHDQSMKKIGSKNDINEKTVKIDSSNIIPALRRSSRANKGKGKEIFDPSHVPSRGYKATSGDERIKSSQSDSDSDNNSDSEKPLKELKPKVKKENETIPVKENKKEDSGESDLSETDDDDDDSYNDPNRLWCICKKPHDDRFMISCDTCQEWYHGDCVGITIQLGKQMERRGEEYVCPKCIEKNNGKSKLKSNVKLKGYAHGRSGKKFRKEDSQPKRRKCIVTTCKNQALDDSVYCSNVCILRHARESLTNKVVSPKREKKKLDKEARKEKARERLMKKISDSAELGRVAVFCCETGKILSGVNAPLKTELKSFMASNASYQVLRLKKSAAPASSNQNKDGHQTISGYSQDPDYKPVKDDLPVEQKARKHKIESSHRHLSSESKKPKKDHEHHHRRHSSESKPAKATSHKSKSSEKEHKVERKNSSSFSNGQDDTIRVNVRKTLRDILSKRSDKSTDLKMHPSSIEKLVRKVEESLFKTYAGVTLKYKSKYRSIMFNLKDEKNEGLWRKVIVGEVTSSSLVKMTAEEMASKKLAQWRQHELSQELELINKLEAEKKSIRPVAKITHKGEIMLDEDLSDLTNSHMGEKSSPTNAPSRLRRISANFTEHDDLKTGHEDTTDQHDNHLFDMNCKICTGQTKETNTSEAASSVKRSTSIILSNEAQAKGYEEELTTEKILQGITSKIKEQVNLQSSPPEDNEYESEANTPPGSPDNVEDISPKTPTKERKIVAKPDPIDLVWSGNISMAELSSFNTNAYAIGGRPDEIKSGMPISLVLDGRIHPKVVWDYIKKVKLLANKEVCVIQFHAASEDDKAGYIAMLSYFSSRRRFGVVNNQNPLKIKDIYLVPLLETEPVPRELLSLKGVHIPKTRHSMLLGVLVLCKPVRHHMTAMEKLGLSTNQNKVTHKKEYSNASLKASPKGHDKSSSQSLVDDIIKKSLIADKQDYNPETANFGDMEGDEPYDPDTYDPTNDVKQEPTDDETPYDPDQEVESLEFSDVKALKEKQAFLEEMKQKLDAQKAQLETTSLHVEQPKKAVDPRMAARMHKQAQNNADVNSPLQKILSVLNMEPKQ